MVFTNNSAFELLAVMFETYIHIYMYFVKLRQVFTHTAQPPCPRPRPPRPRGRPGAQGGGGGPHGLGAIVPPGPRPQAPRRRRRSVPTFAAARPLVHVSGPPYTRSGGYPGFLTQPVSRLDSTMWFVWHQWKADGRCMKCIRSCGILHIAGSTKIII